MKTPDRISKYFQIFKVLSFLFFKNWLDFICYITLLENSN